MRLIDFGQTLEAKKGEVCYLSYNNKIYPYDIDEDSQYNVKDLLVGFYENGLFDCELYKECTSKGPKGLIGSVDKNGDVTLPLVDVKITIKGQIRPDEAYVLEDLLSVFDENYCELQNNSIIIEEGK